MNTPSTVPKVPPGAKYGWFSQSHKDDTLVTHTYLDGTGAKVEVSCVTRDASHGTDWDDMTYVGPVYCYIKSHRHFRAAPEIF